MTLELRKVPSRLRRFPMRVLVFVLLLGLFVVPAEGQTIWSRPYEPNQFAVEVIVPDASDDATILSGATFLTGTVSINDNVELAAELPVARYTTAATDESSASAVGNPYLGFGFSSTTLPFLVQVGARIPVAPSNAATRFAQTADAGRTSAFRPDEFILTSLLNGRLPVGRNSTLRLRTGLGYATYPAPQTTGGRNRDWRMYYDAQIWREGDRLITGLSFTGRANLTTSRDTQHHAGLSIMGNWRHVQPGVVTGTSLNALFQDSELVPFIGLTLSVSYMH